MLNYQAPVDDYLFILNEFLQVQDHADLPGYSDLTPEFCAQLLEGAAQFHEGVFFPIGATGDAEGARLVDGKVKTPVGYKEAWQAYRESGWLALSLPESIGGAGLPQILASALGEMRISTAHSLHMYFGFCISAARMLNDVGEPWMREHVAPKLAAGTWTATMCLTESHCGTDLRQIRTRACPREDGTWEIEGTKIFISGGDHDLAENIMHIVLAKIPNDLGKDESGLESINVFLVPKFEIDPESPNCGQENNVFVDSIEHKMGIEGNATCVLRFDRARAWRIGAGGSGASVNMAPMFMLMNYARVGTALSGVAYAELAVQNAVAYARERLVGRMPGGQRNSERSGDPLIAHPDIRRLLLGARAFAEGGRATALRVLMWQQQAESETLGVRKEVARDLMELLTPVMKAYFTDKGFEATNSCLQVLGGHGYVRDYGFEQLVRNARVGQIYEGANGIQAVDLIQRKLPAKGWRSANTFISELRASAKSYGDSAVLQECTRVLTFAANELEIVFEQVQQRAINQQQELNLATAYDVLEMCGIAAIAWTWCETVSVLEKGTRLSPSCQSRKLICARYWFEREIPKLVMLRMRVQSGYGAIVDVNDADL